MLGPRTQQAGSSDGMYRGDEEDNDDRAFLTGFDILDAKAAKRYTTEKRKKRLLLVSAGIGVLIIAIALVGIIVGAARRHNSPYLCSGHDGASYDLTFFVIGDWGRLGNGNQRIAAKMMADVANCIPPAFIISTGDNFYNHGLKSNADIQIEESFTKVYSQPSLNVNWYAVLGNHDYNDGIDPLTFSSCAANQLEQCPKDCCYSPTWQYTGSIADMRWHCRNGTYMIPAGAGGLVDILMIDTNPFLRRYQKLSWYNNAGGLRSQNVTEIRQQVQQQLAASKATWKLAVGHHPIASFGEHCNFAMEADCTELTWLQQMFKDNGLSAYFCGHDHDLQYIRQLSDPSNSSSDPLLPVYVVSGAGSDVRHDEFQRYRPKDGYVMDFMVNDQGFVAVRANKTHMVMMYYAGSHALPVHTQVIVAGSV